MITLPIFDDPDKVAFCEDQKRRQHMLAEMVRNESDWYGWSDEGQTFEKVVMGMTYDSVANAIEQCTTDDLASWIKYLAIVRMVAAEYAEKEKAIATAEKALEVVK